ncbi:hypothetical protein HUO13_15220 [Saccharopolyspora erythraea]|uniref:hypothetical protein n=1 Tax=Saccharopolyspora erythraea TaxID=1836 RepID=UPI001BAD8513|nr:hypothetical protein [Saccharopolyspora erythraea]QUH01974.1 hypothetical protein HUO13_15220 [Saccharopolyspora erythraea]
MTEVSICEKARPHVYAELVAPDDVDDELVFATMAVDALFSLGDGLFEPLAVNVEVACCDTEFGYPLIQPRPVARFHQLRLAASPETVMIPEIWSELLVRLTERLDRAALLHWLGTLLAEQQCSQSDTRTSWTELIVEAVRARLPEATSHGVESGSNELPVSEGAGVIRYPVERIGDALWVAGPLAASSGTAAFGLRVTNEAGCLSLDWSLNWSPWIDQDGAGRPDIEAAIRRLSAMGWDVTPDPGGYGTSARYR